MRLSTKIFSALFIVTMIAGIVLSKWVIEGINFSGTKFFYVFNAYNIAGLVVIALNTLFGVILYARFLRSLKLSRAIFFSTFPVTLFYAVALFLIASARTLDGEVAAFFRNVLKINSTFNALLWCVLVTLVYLLVVFLIYAYMCRPVQRVEKIALRLSDGRVREENFDIGNSKQFKNIESSLEKINYNYKEKENLAKLADLEAQKFIPKEFLNFLGKNSVAELELGNQVQKHATTLLCSVTGQSKTNFALSLEENFNFINSYLNIVSPIIRKHGGFVDKYLGDGVLAVFPRPENALECSTAICRAIEIKNRGQRSFPNVDERISIHTGEVIFGVIGEEDRKSPTIVSENASLLSKMTEIGSLIGGKVIFSKQTLNDLPTKFQFAYRYIGLVSLGANEKMSLFESLESYPRKKRERLIHLKRSFEDGVRAYNDGNFVRARANFKEVLKYVSDDKASYVYFNKACDKMEEDIS